MKTLVSQLDYDTLHERYTQLKWKERYLEIINNFAIHLMELNTIEEVVWGIAKQVIARMEFLDCVVYLLDSERNILIQKAAHGPKNPEELDIKNPITIPLGKGIVGTVAQTGEPEIVSDTRKDSRYILDDDYRLSEISVPIIYENEVIGVIDSEHPDANFYTQEHLIILKTIAAISANKIKHAQANEQLRNYRKNLEREVDIKTKDLQTAIMNLKRSNKDLESFAYAASHDLQEPLRTILSYLQLIKMKQNDFSSEFQEYFDFVIGGAERMNYMLQGLLAYSRLGNTHKEKAALLDMSNIVAFIIANLNCTIKDNDAQILYDDLHPIRGNKVQIIQLFQNIISNALKFKKEDVVPIIKISSEQKGGFIVFQISDNGIGIAPEYHNKIFTLFRRLHSFDAFQGSGIGLALCKRIIEYHYGEIDVSSVLEEGSTFYLRFPRG